MGKLLLRNGRVIDPASNRDEVADVLLSDGIVAEIGRDLDRTGAEVLDVTDRIVAPGFIDMHVHLREPGFEHAETIETGLRGGRRWVHVGGVHAEYETRERQRNGNQVHSGPGPARCRRERVSHRRYHERK